MKGCLWIILVIVIIYIGLYELSTGDDKFGTLGDVALGLIIFVAIVAIIFAQICLHYFNKK